MNVFKNQYLWFQLFGWLAYACLLLVAIYLKGELTELRAIFIGISASTGLFVSHLIRSTFIRFRFFEFPLFKLIPRTLLLLLVGATLFELVYSSFSGLIDKSVFPTSFSEFFSDVVSLFSVLLIWTIIYFINHFIRKSRLEELKNLQLSSSQNEIELQHLRNQLNPHFLFNALNSIRALVDTEPSLAKQSITQLSIILRNSLLFGRKKQVSLEEECQFVNDYLSLEKIRFEERLTVTWEVDETLKQEMIPPLILQTQVENAIKHGVSTNINGSNLKIILKKLNNYFLIEVCNTGKIQSNTDTGIGISNTQRRLKLMYGENANFDLLEENNEVVARIKIKLS